jgi:hypothetical protein
MKNTKMLRATAVLSGTTFRNVRFKSRLRAENALEHLLFFLSFKPHEVTLKDFYEITYMDRLAVGIGTGWNMTDTEGWTNFDTAKIVPIKYGYMIELPKTVPLPKRPML